MEKLIPLTALIVGAACIYGLHMHLNFKREARSHKDTGQLGERLEAELSKITELKQKIDVIAIKVGLR